MKRDTYPPGVPCWIDATHPDAAAAAGFYSDILGWTYADRMPGDAHYFVAQLDGLDAQQVYLDGMVKHHQGAVALTETQIREGFHPDAVALAREILARQQSEIARLQELQTG